MILEDCPENGLLCCVCREPQYESPGGAVCRNGHGGAPGVVGTRPEPSSNTLTRLNDCLDEAAACGMLDDLQGFCRYGITISDFTTAVQAMVKQSES